MTTRVFVPGDSSALSVGADAVAIAIAAEARRRGVDLAIVRTGSRGLFWLEPLVGVESDEGRIGYGPISAEEVPALFDAGFPPAGPHPKAHGRVEEIPFLRVSSASCSRVAASRIRCRSKIIARTAG